MRLDFHTHVFHPKIADKVLAQLQDHYGIVPKGQGLAEDLIGRLDRAGLDRAVVHTAATDASQVVPANNWALALLREHPERIIPFGSLHPDFGPVEKESDRLEAAGIKGLKFHPDFQGFRLDDPRFYEIMELVWDRFVLMIHVGDVLPPDQNPSCPIKLAALLDAFPGARIIAAHLGGYLHWQWALEHLVGRDVYLDTSSSLPYIDDALLAAILSGHPKERVLFGSDYPLFDPGEEIERLRTRLDLSDREVDQLLCAGVWLLDATG